MDRGGGGILEMETESPTDSLTREGGMIQGDPPILAILGWFMTKFFRVLFLSLLLSYQISSVAFAIDERVLMENFSKSIATEFDKHNHKKIIKLYEDFRDQNLNRVLPFRPRVMYCQALAEVGDTEGAIKNLKELVADWPVRLDIIKIQYDLANLLFMQGMKDEARDVFEKIILQSDESAQIVQKSKERLFQLKQMESKKKDVTGLQILEIQTSLEIGEISQDSISFLKKVIETEPNTRNSAKAREVLQRANELRTQRYKSLLDEARRLFDEEKKYQEAQEIIDNIERDYADILEAPSVEALKKAIKEKVK